jgi:glucan-binding YG repeat protein
MIKRLVLSLLMVVSVMGITSVGASAEWKQDKYKNWTWVEKGVQAKGWKYIDNNWYNFGNNGTMVKGWMEDNGSWYYFWSNGTMANKCWLWNGGFWYYFDAEGKLVLDSTTVESRKYDFTAPAIITSETTTGSNALYSNN